ncbi:MAG: hypothetical protein ACR2FO_06600 [Actinomycetota bacterium]
MPPEVQAGTKVPSGRSWLQALLGVAMATLGAGAFLIGSSLEAGSATPVGDNVPINEGALLKTDINAHNSPAAVRNPVKPGNLVVVNRIDTPRFSCGMHISTDGGGKWKDQEIPFPVGEEDPPRCFAPDAAFSSDGTLYVSFVTLIGPGNRPNALWLVSSTDGGTTLSTPARVLPSAPPFLFQSELTADPKIANRLYLSYLKADDTSNLAFPNTGNPIEFLRSDDGGATWIGPISVSPPSRQRVITPSTVVGPGGEVYMLYLDLGEDKLDYNGGHEGQGGLPYDGKWSLVLARSKDGGENWQESVVDDQIVPIERFIIFFPSAPSLAVDQTTGRIYVAFHDGRLGSADVLLWTSTNGGKSFSKGQSLNDNPVKDGTAQYLPKIAVAPNGRVDVVYYDRQADPKNIKNEVSLQSSVNGDTPFGPRIRLTDPGKSFSSEIGFGSERKMPDLGSRLGLVSTDTSTLAVWTDTRGGTEASNKQDLGRAVVAFSKESPARDPLRIGGPILIIVGLVILMMWAAGGRRKADRAG